MHDFRAYIFAKANNPLQRGLSAIAELLVFALWPDTTRNSSGDEIAKVNFLYDDIVHAV